VQPAMCDGDLMDLGRINNWRLHMSTSAAQISAWGNGLALRLTKPMAKIVGVTEGSPVRVTVKPGRIVIETEAEPTLDQMLASFDPKKHGGEVMAGRATGVEAFADSVA
ncbi:hypothetical protein, partial [Escherichia coli]|uniref:AbrB/MazE/SpoVT family DNA-binding domain-containing protein n=4 Tax=cellular organisms TaxID=131567 RepID=UPI001BE42E49